MIDVDNAGITVNVEGDEYASSSLTGAVRVWLSVIKAPKGRSEGIREIFGKEGSQGRQ